ncbi:MAG: Lysine-sensitive aspartokinase 3 [Gemmatimonadaceae bacterium]|nr:Lysine-sensitive aspartokinase 3 [Gemmatimonadaceae bacterium]
MIVVKFGGTSVQDTSAVLRAAEVVRGRLSRRPVVVVSALGGATNALLAIAEQASQGHLISALSAVEGLRDRHLRTAEELLAEAPSAQAADVMADLSATFDELASLAEALSVLGHVTPRSMDAIAAKGEMLSSELVVAAFRARDIPATHVNAMHVMVTGEQYGRAEPLPERIAEAARRHVRPLVERGEVPVLGGFVGATELGIVTTLGRGGSDYSASLFGAALGADAIEIWTDVDGMLTADPRVVPDAQLIERIGFDEASELASFGAKVLHPSTIAPAVRLGIPVYIYNSRNPSGRGTQITFDAPVRDVRAIAGKQGVTVVKVRSPRMLLAHGFLRTVFEIFDKHRTSIDVVATSEVSVSLTVDDATHLDGLVVDLSQLGDVSVERNRGIVALVGANLGNSSEAMSRALAAISPMKVHMLSLSASGINLTILVDGDQVAPAMRALHRAFFGVSND